MKDSRPELETKGGDRRIAVPTHVVDGVLLRGFERGVKGDGRARLPGPEWPSPRQAAARLFSTEAAHTRGPAARGQRPGRCWAHVSIRAGLGPRPIPAGTRTS